MFRMTQLSTLVYKYFMKKKNSSLFLFLFILSCASPKVVNVYGPNDSSLSCEELSNEIAIANEYANKAQEAKKMNKPHNIGAAILFLPGYGISMKNIDEATKAANERSLHLTKIKEKKNC